MIINNNINKKPNKLNNILRNTEEKIEETNADILNTAKFGLLETEKK